MRERVAYLLLALVEFVPRTLPLVEGDAGVDGGKEVDELLVGAEPVRVELLVQPVQQVVAFHGISHVRRS